MSSYTNWKQREVFPIVYNTLLGLTSSKKWVTHEEIVDALMTNLDIQRNIYRVIATKEELRDILSNIVAWFSQRITEYETGQLDSNYSVYDIIEDAYCTFDRKKESNNTTYSYRITDTKKQPHKVLTKEKILQKRFSEYVEYLKTLKLTGKEYRQKVMEWWRQYE